MQYSINEPCTYSVRWTAIRQSFASGRPAAGVVARSEWLTFAVEASTPGNREACERIVDNALMRSGTTDETRKTVPCGFAGTSAHLLAQQDSADCARMMLFYPADATVNR
jgi:hypothetical protein